MLKPDTFCVRQNPMVNKVFLSEFFDISQKLLDSNYEG